MSPQRGGKEGGERGEGKRGGKERGRGEGKRGGKEEHLCGLPNEPVGLRKVERCAGVGGVAVVLMPGFGKEHLVKSIEQTVGQHWIWLPSIIVESQSCCAVTGRAVKGAPRTRSPRGCRALGRAAARG